MIAIYARKSVSKDRTKEVSLQVQIDACYAKLGLSPGDPSVKVFKDNDRTGATTSGRDSLSALMDLVKADRVSTVCVYKIDRLSRKITDFYRLYETMNRHNCAFVSVNDPIDTGSAAGKATLALLASFAEIEHDNISLRVKDSYVRRAEQGRWLGGTPPYGYKAGKDSDGRSTLIIDDTPLDPANADENNPATMISPSVVVGLLFNQYVYEGSSLYGLTAYLHENFNITRNSASIRNILTNEKYAPNDLSMYKYYKSLGCTLPERTEWTGKKAIQIYNTRRHGTDHNAYAKSTPTTEWIVEFGNWEPLIPSEVFLMAQQRLAENKKLPIVQNATGKSRNRWKELSGLMRCARCGSSVRVIRHFEKRTQKEYLNLTCALKYLRKDSAADCGVCFYRITVDQVRANVGAEINRVLHNFASREQQKQAYIDGINAQIAEKETAIDNLLKLAETTPTKRISDRITEITQEIDVLRDKTTLANISDAETLYLRLFSVFDDIADIDYMRLSEKDRRTVLSVLCDKILLHKDGKVTIKYKYEETE